MELMFDYFECPECQFSSVQHSSYNGKTFCPLCASDSGHYVSMNRRPAKDTDKAEGHDARKLFRRIMLDAGIAIK